MAYKIVLFNLNRNKNRAIKIYPINEYKYFPYEHDIHR